jgi:hypothetical protein
MTQSLAKYHIRSPRYILQPEDNTIIRVAGPNQIPWEEGTEIKNISLTGIAFTVPLDLCPSIGEFIKIQYSAPGAQQMACYALVTRIEDYSQNLTLVGVKFYRVDLAHRVLLAQSLALKLKDQQTKKIEEARQKLSFFNRSLPFLFLAVWGLLFFVSTRSELIKYLKFSND